MESLTKHARLQNHTRFPEYIHARTRAPLSWSYAALHRFHAPSSGIMVTTDTVEKDLRDNGFANIKRWTRGVDTELFKPLQRKNGFADRPVSLYVGRVAIEKNVRAFLDLRIPGTKFVVGDGPQLASFKSQYPNVCFTGAKTGKELAYHYANADVFVFPSRTDTFGLVILEALASGVPVVAYPVTGPLDVINGADVGALDEDLNVAVRRALTVPAWKCREYALAYSWDRSVEQFLSNIHVFR